MGAEPLAQPLQLLLLVLVCTLVMVVAGLRIITMYSEGTISLAELAIYAILVLAAFGGTLAQWGTLSGGLLGAGFVTLCLAFPVLQRIADQRLADRLLRRDIAKCHRLLQFDPHNTMVHSRLGDIHMRLRDIDAAVAEYQQAAELSPKDKVVQRRLQRAIETKRRQDVQSRFCPRCQTENQSSAVYCRKCATPLNAWAELRHGIQHITPAHGLKWGAIVGGAGVLLASAGFILPRTAAILVAVSLGLAAVVYLGVRPLR